MARNSKIAVCVGNEGYYAEGQLRDTWIELPVPDGEIERFLDENGLRDPGHGEIYISDYDGIPLGLSYGGVFGEYTSLRDLNLLAKQIELSPDAAEKVRTAMRHGVKEPSSIVGLMNWLAQPKDLPTWPKRSKDYALERAARADRYRRGLLNNMPAEDRFTKEEIAADVESRWNAARGRYATMDDARLLEEVARLDQEAWEERRAIDATAPDDPDYGEMVFDLETSLQPALDAALAAAEARGLVGKGPEPGLAIKVCVGNYGYYAEGQLRDQWIDLPKTDEEIERFLDENGLRDDIHEEIYISDYDGIPLGMSYGRVFGEHTSLYDLNLLAKQIELYPDAAKKVRSTVECGIDEPSSVVGLMNWIAQADDVPYHEYSFEGMENYEKIDPEEKYGLALADALGVMRMLKDRDIDPYFDYKQFGSDELISGSDVPGENGYVDGTEKMPAEDALTRAELAEVIGREWDARHAAQLAWERSRGIGSEDTPKRDAPEPAGRDDRHILLSRLKQDCDYFLGAGFGYEAHLSTGGVEAQIEKMRELLEGGEPEWLSPDDVDRYERRMLRARDFYEENRDQLRQGPPPEGSDLSRKMEEIANGGLSYVEREKAAALYDASAYDDTEAFADLHLESALPDEDLGAFVARLRTEDLSQIASEIDSRLEDVPGGVGVALFKYDANGGAVRAHASASSEILGIDDAERIRVERIADRGGDLVIATQARGGDAAEIAVRAVPEDAYAACVSQGRPLEALWDDALQISLGRVRASQSEGLTTPVWEAAPLDLGAALVARASRGGKAAVAEVIPEDDGSWRVYKHGLREDAGNGEGLAFDSFSEACRAAESHAFEEGLAPGAVETRATLRRTEAEMAEKESLEALEARGGVDMDALKADLWATAESREEFERALKDTRLASSLLGGLGPYMVFEEEDRAARAQGLAMLGRIDPDSPFLAVAPDQHAAVRLRNADDLMCCLAHGPREESGEKVAYVLHDVAFSSAGEGVWAASKHVGSKSHEAWVPAGSLRYDDLDDRLKSLRGEFAAAVSELSMTPAEQLSQGTLPSHKQASRVLSQVEGAQAYSEARTQRVIDARRQISQDIDAMLDALGPVGDEAAEAYAEALTAGSELDSRAVEGLFRKVRDYVSSSPASKALTADERNSLAWALYEDYVSSDLAPSMWTISRELYDRGIERRWEPALPEKLESGSYAWTMRDKDGREAARIERYQDGSVSYKTKNEKRDAGRPDEGAAACMVAAEILSRSAKAVSKAAETVGSIAPALLRTAPEQGRAR